MYEISTFSSIYLCVGMIATHLRLRDPIEFLGFMEFHHETFENPMLESDMGISKLLRSSIDTEIRLDRHRFGDPNIFNYTLAISLVAIDVEVRGYGSLTPIMQALLVCRCWQVPDVDAGDFVREFSLQSRLISFESFLVFVVARVFSETRHL